MITNYQVQRRRNGQWITVGMGGLEVATSTARAISQGCGDMFRVVSPGGFTVFRLHRGFTIGADA